MIKVSVIMPSLNVGGYIEESLQSAVNQTLKDIEIICIDAGSTDGTWESLQKIAAEDARIILIKTQTKSYGYQVNLGLAVARGEYIAVLETDDFVSPEMYERLYEIAGENDCDYVKADYMAYWTQTNGERVYLNRKNLSDTGLYDRVLCPKQYPILGTDDWYLWTGIYKKSFLDSILFSETPGAAFQDIGFLVQTTQKANRVIFIKDKFYNYCIDREGASSNQGKGFAYSYEEFQKILRIGSHSEEELKLLYGRMAKSFVCCCGELAADRLGDERVSKLYGWFLDNLRRAVKQKLITEHTIGKPLWIKLSGMLENDTEYLLKEHSYRQRFLEKTMPENKSFPIVIFGCGNIGYGAYRWLLKENGSVSCFMDNNSKLWGSRINNIEVKNPLAARELPADTYYLVANESYAEEIKSQLESLDVEPEHIYIYR